MLLAVSVTTAVGTFIGPAIIAQFLDILQHHRTISDTAIWWLVVGFAFSQLWSEVIGWRVTLYLTWTLESAIQRDLYHKIFNKLSNETLFFHTNKFSGSLVSQSNKLVGAAERFWDTIIWSITPFIVSVIGSVVILGMIFWQFSLFLALFSIVFIVVVFFGSRPMAALNEAEAKASNKLSGQLSDVVSNIVTVKSSASEVYELESFISSTENWREKVLATMKGFLKASTAYSLISTSITVGALAFAAYASQHDMLSIATIYLIVSYTASVTQRLWNMNGIMRSYNRIIGDSEEMVTILTKDTHLFDKGTRRLTATKGSISFNHVTYTHDEGAGETLFRDFSLHIKSGESVGLVGLSGSGKTTLVKLLLRFSDIDSGDITIDTQNIATVTQQSLRRAIAYVPQEPLLFHRSIRENIAYTKPAASEKEIIDAAKKSGALQFINDLPEGFDTLVGERGIKLSGGQRQRIAIARAILKDAPILVLDEATSALDSESEALIQKSLTHLMKQRTSLVIAHRLSTIAKLDRIVVLQDGKIIEDGCHEQLLRRHGLYARLWQRQSGGFIDE